MTPLFAITTLSICVGIYFLCNGILRMELIDRGRYNILALIVGIVIAIIPVIVIQCGLELIYAVFLILIGIITYIAITHIGYAYPLAKNKPSSEGFYNFKNEAILIQNGAIFSIIFSTNGLKMSAPTIPKKRPATISPG